MRRAFWWPKLSMRLLGSFVFILWGAIYFTNVTINRILTRELPAFELQTITRYGQGLARDLEQSYAETGILSVRLLDDPPRQSLRLYDAQGIEIATSSPWPAHTAIVRQTLANRSMPVQTVVQDDAQRYGFQVLPLRHEGKIIGALEVADALPPIDRFVDSIRSDLIRAALIAVGSIIAVAMMLGGYVRKGLQEIKLQTEAIVRGDFDRRSGIRGNDEMGRIGGYLNQMAEDLGQLAQTRNEFLSKVSHELRTPLTIAKGFTSLLRNGEVPPQHARTVAIIDTQIDDLTRLVNDLLDLSRREHSSMDLRTTPIDCGKLVAEVVERQRHVLREQKVALELRCMVKQAPIRGDQQRLHQVLGNLLGNAARYARSRTTLELDVDAQHAILRVRDDGPGIALEDQARIFEPFFQSRNGPRGQAGLGLTVARELVLGHGGTIAVSAEPGAGTTFTIMLPRTDATAATRHRSWRDLITRCPRRRSSTGTVTQVVDQPGLGVSNNSSEALP